MHTICRKYGRWRGLVEAGRLLAGFLKMAESGQPRGQKPVRRRRRRNAAQMEPRTRGEWIYLMRIEADLNREELAQRLCVCDVTIRAWENNESAPTEAQWDQLKELLIPLIPHG